MARYLAVLSEKFPAGPADCGALVEMIRVNTGQEVDPPDVEGHNIACDGRMLPHEWIAGPAGWLKTDALDHHNDHFFPGCQDIAWDIAGAAVEFGFDPAVLARRVTRLRPDDSLLERLPFYTSAYLAYRIGYCTLAVETLGDAPDADRFRRLLDRYLTACGELQLGAPG